MEWHNKANNKLGHAPFILLTFDHPPPMAHDIFGKDVFYITAETFSESHAENLSKTLSACGGTPSTSIEDCTVVITNTSRFEGYQQVDEGKVVTVRRFSATCHWPILFIGEMGREVSHPEE